MRQAAPGAADLDGVTGWLVRRAGVARLTTIAAAAGLAAAASLGPHPWIAATGLASLLAAQLLSVVGGGPGADRVLRRRLLPWSIVLLGLFVGLLLGSVRVMSLDHSDLVSLAGERATARLTVTGAVRTSQFGQSAAAELDLLVFDAGVPPALAAAAPAGRAAAVRESVWLEVKGSGEDGVTLKQGQVVIARVAIAAPKGVSASGFDQRSYLRNRGIQVVLRAGGSDVEVVGARGGVAGWFDRFRASAVAHLSMGPDPRLDELLQGIVMGDTAGMDEEWMEGFRRSGTAHMFSVSGLHVASLAAIIIGLAKLFRAPRFVGFALAAAAALLMIPFVGAEPPIVRAAVMILVVLVGRWIGRGRDQWQVLAFAAVVILAANPYAIYDVGFQLSFSAFTGMMTLVPPLQRALRFLPETLAGNAAVSIAASMGTAPVALVAFGRTSIVAVFANLVVVPLLPVMTGLGLAAVGLGFVWTGLSAALDTALAPILAWTVVSSRFFGAAPVLETGHLARGLGAVVAGLLLLPAALALAGSRSRLSALPGCRGLAARLRGRGRRRRRLVAALGVAAILVAGALGWALYPQARSAAAWASLEVRGGWPDAVEVRVLDVGQGNAVLVRTPDRRALLIDGGPDGCGLDKQLRALGVSKLDLLLVSHPHADHFAGLLEGLEGIEVGVLVDGTEVVRPPPGAGADTSHGSSEAAAYLELRRILQDRGCRHVPAQTGMLIEFGQVDVRLYAPEKPLRLADGPSPWALRGRAPGGDELNARSLVALVSVGEMDVLVPGDAEADALRRYALPEAEALIVSHHGSKGAVTEELLQSLRLDLAVISVGRDNTFGHPAPDILALLGASGVATLRTDTAGWVCLVLKEDEMAVTTERRAGQ